MFVPSLSWHKDDYWYTMAQKWRFPYLAHGDRHRGEGLVCVRKTSAHLNSKSGFASRSCPEPVLAMEMFWCFYNESRGLI
jgi:hypothetical protein